MMRVFFNSAVIIFMFFGASHVRGSSLHDHIKALNVSNAIAQIDKNKDLNERQEGFTPLHLAVKYELFEVVVALVQAGANTNILSPEKETPSLMALKIDNTKILKYLIQSGAIIEGDSFYSYFSTKQEPSFEKFDLQSDQDFINNIISLLQHEIARELLPFIYPFFIHDEDFVQALVVIAETNKAPSWQISQVLHAWINTDFPNGMPSTKALQKIIELIKKIKISPTLQIKMWTALKLKRNEFTIKKTQNSAIIPRNPNIDKKTWDDLDPHSIAHALTEYDERLLKNISLFQLRLWREYPQHADGIDDCLAAHKRFSN